MQEKWNPRIQEVFGSVKWKPDTQRLKQNHCKAADSNLTVEFIQFQVFFHPFSFLGQNDCFAFLSKSNLKEQEVKTWLGCNLVTEARFITTYNTHFSESTS